MTQGRLDPQYGELHRGGPGRLGAPQPDSYALDVVGRDNATFETDYPHVDSTFPHTKEVALD
ncbi:hypothetical protein ACWD95_10025, partial [Streptomyces sp. NPDC005069]